MSAFLIGVVLGIAIGSILRCDARRVRGAWRRLVHTKPTASEPYIFYSSAGPYRHDWGPNGPEDRYLTKDEIFALGDRIRPDWRDRA